MNEFDIIKNYFATQIEKRSDVVCGIGDDAAIVNVPTNQELAITTDTLGSGMHFLPDALPFDIGYKSLAVNLSDLAAMGATPAWATLALTLPNVDTDWLQNFSYGFFTLANRFKVQLIGGDITKGPLAINITAMGFIPAKQAILRSQAKAHDLIYVTGTLGDAAFALQMLRHKISIETTHQHYFMNRLTRPEPRIIVGEHLRNLATSAIDISDGLTADLNHILKQSRVGAVLNINQLPLSQELIQNAPLDKALEFALTGGDDYELCFTVPKEKSALLEKTLSSLPCRFTCIGEVVTQPELILRNQDGSIYDGKISGFQHF